MKAALKYSRSAPTLWFAVVVAICAAAIANPCIEFAANAGWFGRGNFTDHSNIDVVPTLLVGFTLLAIYIAKRLGALLIGRKECDVNVFGGAWPIARLVPLAYALQLGVLYCMETIEQRIAHGYVLGGSIWLGGPAFVSLSLHLLACVLVAILLGRALDGFEQHAHRIIEFVRLFDVFAHARTERCAVRRSAFVLPLAPVQCRIGERAPPYPA